MRGRPVTGRQFALYDMPGQKRGCVVDVQANRLSHLDRRVVLPLLPAEAKPPVAPPVPAPSASTCHLMLRTRRPAEPSRQRQETSRALKARGEKSAAMRY